MSSPLGGKLQSFPDFVLDRSRESFYEINASCRTVYILPYGFDPADDTDPCTSLVKNLSRFIGEW